MEVSQVTLLQNSLWVGELLLKGIMFSIVEGEICEKENILCIN